MNTSADNHDDGAELQAVMGAYFDALLHEAGIKAVDNKPCARADISAGQNLSVSAPAAAAAVMPVVGSENVNADVDSSASVTPLASPAEVLAEVTEFINVTAVLAEKIPDVDSEPQASAVPAYQLIQLGGVTLGIATDAIAKIKALPTSTAPAKGDPAWVLGSYEVAQGTSTIVDTAAVLLPNNPRRSTARESYIVQLKDQPWALACDAIGDVLTPDPGQVTWRGAEGKRPWLAGTIRTPTCALLDICELIKLFTV